MLHTPLLTLLSLVWEATSPEFSNRKEVLDSLNKMNDRGLPLSGDSPRSRGALPVHCTPSVYQALCQVFTTLYMIK